MYGSPGIQYPMPNVRFVCGKGRMSGMQILVLSRTHVQAQGLQGGKMTW